MPSALSDSPKILVLSGVNGAGKSSLGGKIIRERGIDYFNPDEAARRIGAAKGCSADEANALAWEEGRRQLESAINGRFSHAFESTLGGNTIPGLLIDASRAGIDVIVWFVGLSSPERHIARVRARVAAGGHDIPEEMIRKRWDTSRRNLIALLPHLTGLRVYDNSNERSPAHGSIPEPRLLLHWRLGKIVAPRAREMLLTPEWAKPIVAAALKLQRSPK
ncbi:MAG TPA: ZTL protein [Thermoanaerobaculia bacterium]|jgi:predicted ABC-type ATPase|nr:ZTL protein [Thermoanaerobaculia bacterium]